MAHQNFHKFGHLFPSPFILRSYVYEPFFQKSVGFNSESIKSAYKLIATLMDTIKSAISAAVIKFELNLVEIRQF